LAKDSKSEKVPGSSSTRMLHVLDFFTLEKPVWTVEELQDALSSSRATTYRYVKALVDAGLLAPATEGAYVLGSRIIELDRQIRLSDPLLAAARQVMEQVSAETGANLMLCSFYGEKVMCIDREWVDTSFQSSFERGRPMPLFKGATAKMILAYLPPYHQRNILLHNAREIAEVGLGETWEEFRENMKALRREVGHVSYGEVDPTLIGIGAGILLETGEVVGSISFIAKRADTGPERIEMLRERIARAAGEIADRLGSLDAFAGGSGQITRSSRRLTVSGG